eukprot:356188-Chlamydomonas_euryale.AAC.1
MPQHLQPHSHSAPQLHQDHPHRHQHACTPTSPWQQEVGPFTYRKFKIKVHAWWDREGDVLVKEWDYFVPVPGLVGQPDPTSAMVTTLNMALVGVVETIRATFTPTYAAWLEKMAVWLARCGLAGGRNGCGRWGEWGRAGSRWWQSEWSRGEVVLGSR